MTLGRIFRSASLPQEEGADRSDKTSSLIISEFVGCSPSMSGAIRVNPWSVDDVADGIYSAIKMSKAGEPLLPAVCTSQKWYLVDIGVH